MSKKDYQAIARALHGAVLDVERGATSPRTVLTVAINRVAEVLAADSPRFDRARFIEACETGRCKGMKG